MKVQLAFSACLAMMMLAARANAMITCDRVLSYLADRAADVVCLESHDLTTTNPATTPEDNSLPGWPIGAFTPRTDRATISLGTPIDREVPGIQVQGRFANDPTGQARFLLRFPNHWNGKLVVAGASGTRSEFNGDFAWSDFVVQKGYAYASQNKGVLNLYISNPDDPLACRLNPVPPLTWVHFYDNDPEKPFTQWQQYIVRAARLARGAVHAHYRRVPHRTYAVGTSNGGYQVRRAIEEAPDLFDGGIDWEGTFVDPDGPNILIDLPPALRNMPDYIASGHDPDSPAAQNILAAGYPPDIIAAPLTLWERYYLSFWEVTMCQWQKRLDPTYDTYGSGPDNYDYFERRQETDVAQQLAAFQVTGRIRRPLITVAGTMDGLLPIERQARAYAAKVASHHHRHSEYRLYEVQNGNHIESYTTFYPQLELIQPHAQRAFDLLVDHVEHHEPLPPSQCIRRGSSIVENPESEQCAELFVP